MNTSTSMPRWLLKKTARLAVATSSLAAGRQRGSPRLHTLTYHRFGEATRDPFCVSAREFDNQMSYLADRSMAVSLREVEEYLSGRRDLPRDSVLVTIDDGFLSTYSAALPVLKRYNIPAVAFISPGLINGHVPGGQAGTIPEPYIGWDEAARLAEGGVDLGSHSLSHRSVARIDNAQARDEIFRSRQMIEEHTGTTVTAFAYPYGTRADFNPFVAGLVREAGYRCAFTSQHGAITAHSDAFMLPRVKVEGGEKLWMFRKIAQGAMDGWGLIDRALWRIQASGDD
jgi:peptidoglycan/xylan/chitin deacetylase (PgdA/CDA1 family)